MVRIARIGGILAWMNGMGWDVLHNGSQYCRLRPRPQQGPKGAAPPALQWHRINDYIPGIHGAVKGSRSAHVTIEKWLAWNCWNIG
jgi:hypothetical protein